MACACLHTEKNTWRWLTVLHQSNAALHQMGRTDSATFQFFRYRNDNSSSEHIKMYAEYTSNALFRLFVVCLTNVWKKKKNIREKFKKATTTHKKDILVTKDTRRKMRLLKTSTYGVEQHTQFGTIFFVCVSFACSFFLCYYPMLCPPARDQHAYTCLFSRVFLSRTAKKQYHDRLLMNVNRYFLRLLNDDISEKKRRRHGRRPLCRMLHGDRDTEHWWQNKKNKLYIGNDKAGILEIPSRHSSNWLDSPNLTTRNLY